MVKTPKKPEGIRKAQCECGAVRSLSDIHNHIEVAHDGDDAWRWHVIVVKP
jgi:hypothetical protein